MVKPSEKRIEAAKSTLRQAGYILDLWHEEDVQEVAAEDLGRRLTPAEMTNVKESLEEIDANEGLNWDTVAIIVNQHTGDAA